MNNLNNQHQTERDAWFQERTQIEKRHADEIRQKNDHIDRNNKDHLAKVQDLQNQHAQQMKRTEDNFN